jgi:vacuolar-type H+-ATPase subunit I/STV1
MSRDFDDISKQIIQQSKELKGIDNHISKDIVDLKKSIKNIENKLKAMDDTLVKLFDILTNITVFIEDAEDINNEDLEDEEDWTPYDERNFSYKDNDDEDNDDDEWGIKEDQS